MYQTLVDSNFDQSLVDPNFAPTLVQNSTKVWICQSSAKLWPNFGLANFGQTLVWPKFGQSLVQVWFNVKSVQIVPGLGNCLVRILIQTLYQIRALYTHWYFVPKFGSKFGVIKVCTKVWCNLLIKFVPNSDQTSLLAGFVANSGSAKVWVNFCWLWVGILTKLWQMVGQKFGLCLVQTLVQRLPLQSVCVWHPCNPEVWTKVCTKDWISQSLYQSLDAHKCLKLCAFPKFFPPHQT